ncbi:hypothetical protein SLEP1_g51175 [Rubroshorea leprosula]|uniref:B3 domain-containing protein n=1 Tax=Rubroshorea leprosula TaxID=152421 RepID=A0AAV5M5L9_9ROSI|nr:hypothetical protein SLEP1_g51175 [Rubroshorea leprosula]
MSSVVSSMDAISSSFSQPEFESLPSSSRMLPSDDAPMLPCFLPIPDSPVGSELQTLKNPVLDHEKKGPVSLALPSSSTMLPSDDASVLFCFLPIPEKPVGSELQTLKDPVLDHEDKGPVSLDLTLTSASGSKKRPPDAENPQRKRRRRVGNSMTELRLGVDPWSIKKTLEPSDLVGGLSRLLVASEDVQNHILPYLDTVSAEELINGHNMAVVVTDVDTKTKVEMVLRRWISSGSYVLKKNWVNGFVKRRELQEGDEIGLEWDKGNSSFNFSVLKRAATA